MGGARSAARPRPAACQDGRPAAPAAAGSQRHLLCVTRHCQRALSAPPHHTASALSLSAACNPQIPHTKGAARTNLRVASSPSFLFVEMWCCAGWWCSFLGVGSPTAVRIRPAGGVLGRIHTCYSVCTTHTLHTRWAARTNLCVPSFRLWRRGACWVVVLVPRGQLAQCSSDPAIGRCGGARPHVTWNETGRQWLGMGACSRVDGR